MAAKVLAVFFSLLGALQLLGDQTLGGVSEFDAWKKQFNINYQSVMEDAYRREIFEVNYQNIRSHNNNQTKTYKKALNIFSDLTNQQFKQLYLSNSHNTEFQNIDTQQENKNYTTTEVDWLNYGAVNQPPILNNKCSFDYASTAVSIIQGINKIQYDILQQLSYQQIIDCSVQFGNSGCTGGTVQNSLHYILKSGINNLNNYPLTYQKNQCYKKQEPFKITGKIKKIKGCNKLSESVTSTPISVRVDASQWKDYGSGIYVSPYKQLNLCVLLVGIQGGNWKVRGVWGKNWGQNGYIRLLKGNTCGICTQGLTIQE